MRSMDFPNASIRWKIVGIIFVVLAVSLLLVGAGLLVHTRASFERDITQRLAVLADVIGENSVAALLFSDAKTAAETLAALDNDERIIAGAVYDKDGRLLAQYRRPAAEVAIPPAPPLFSSAPVFSSDRVTLVRPIELRGEPAGVVYLVADTADWTATLQQFLVILVTLFAAVLAVGLLVSIGLQRLVTGPIQDLAALMRRIGRERDPRLRAVKGGNDEIGVLVDGFNDMLDEIAKRRLEAEAAKQELQQRVAELDAEVAERRRAEAELHRSRDHLQDFIENANIGLNWLAPDGTILWANHHELEMLGYGAEEYVGRRAADFHLDRQTVEDLLAGLANDEIVESREARMRHKDGSVRDVLISASVYRENGKFVHARSFTHDITERKCIEDALKRSEARYRTLVAATTSVVFSTDGAGRVIERLPSWEDYTGQRWPRYAGDGWAPMVHRDDRRRLKAAWLRATGEGKMFEAEVRVRHQRSGRHRYCLVRALPQRQPGGPAYEWIGTLMDIDDRKRAEERFRTAVDGAPNAMIMIDDGGHIVLVNRQLEALFGYRREELRGRSVETLVPERARSAHVRHRTDFFKDPRARAMCGGRDIYGRHKNGREIPVEISLSPFRTEEGFLGLASIMDVSERRRAEQELRRYTAELQRSNRELGQFAYVASHDLQEPLRAISGCVQLLQQRYRDKLDARANELIEHTVGGALRMQALINDLLSYSRVSTRARPFEACDLGQPLRQALANLELAIKESGATVTMDPMPVLQVDNTQVTQLFQNLIGNALKFRADRTVHVHVGAQRKSNGYLFSVQDNGIGIEPQHIERIFGVFQRLHNRNKYPGNGIGLAICRKIIERHNGRIWVESVPGKGSTFHFTLAAGNVQNEEPSELYSSQQ